MLNWSFFSFVSGQFVVRTIDGCSSNYFKFIFSPNSVGTLRGSYGRRKAGLVRSLPRRRVRLIRCYLQHIHDSQHRPCALRLCRLAKSGWPQWVLLATTLSLWCRVHGGDFSRQAQGKPRALVLQSRLFVTGARDRSCFKSKCTFRGRRSTLDMVVTVEELRFRDRCSAS